MVALAVCQIREAAPSPRPESPSGAASLAPEKGPGILSLRKCTRGAPLLPKGMVSALEPIEWEAQSGARPLKEYLCELLARLSIPDIVIEDSVDGQRLAPYQAAVQLEEWSRTWQRLEGPFREQRAAYRRLFGGTGAPELTIGAKPKFVSGAWVSRPRTGFPSLDQTPASEPMYVEVAETLAGLALTSRGCTSGPCRVLLAGTALQSCSGDASPKRVVLGSRKGAGRSAILAMPGISVF